MAKATTPITAEIKNGRLLLSLPITSETVANMPASASGKTRIVASTRGNAVTALEIDGKPVIVGLNAYVK